MAWTIKWRDSAYRDLYRLDRPIQRRILKFLDDRVASSENPRRVGKALAGDKSGLWRYQVGDYRLICRIEYDRLVVLVVGLGHRSEIYR
ncbi:MAG: type II toxin-antitoxin system RelE/ParE family toxin [bacterium]|nr:type II toxin-antitoxin system RelE/ParE family toxin [bacterium]